MHKDLASGDVRGYGDGGGAGVGDVLGDHDTVGWLDVAACLEFEGYGSARWVAPGKRRWLTGRCLDTRWRVVDDIIIAALRCDEGGEGKNKWQPRTHDD